jgi:hypothetical protein
VQATVGSSAPPSGGGGGGASLLSSMSDSPSTSLTTETYYEGAVGGASAKSLETTDPTLPTYLAIDDDDRDGELSLDHDRHRQRVGSCASTASSAVTSARRRHL